MVLSILFQAMESPSDAGRFSPNERPRKRPGQPERRRRGVEVTRTRVRNCLNAPLGNYVNVDTAMGGCVEGVSLPSSLQSGRPA
jgi:hypothetical protein